MPSRALIERAERLRRRGTPHKALSLLTAGLNQPHSGEAWLRLKRAECYSDLARWELAEKESRKALQAGMMNATPILARSLLELQRAHEAATILECHCWGNPDNSRDWALYARALSAASRHDDAIRAMARARTSDPNLTIDMSDILIAAGKHTDNIALIRHELGRLQGGPSRANPSGGTGASEQARLWANLGFSLSALGESAPAVNAFNQALGIDPKLPGARWALGVCLLRLGLFEEGFACHEHRQKAAGECRRLGVKPWCGEPLFGKHLVVTIEQGFGDTVQFIRFLPQARRLARSTTLIAPPNIERVLSSNPDFGELRTTHPGFGFGDHQTLIMSLPHRLGVAGNLEQNMGPCPYLFAEPALVAEWRRRLPQGLKIALVWQGNPAYGGDRWRSMPFTYYEPLVARFKKGVTFLSLQKHFGREQLESSLVRDHVLDLGDEIDNGSDSFVDSLAILSLVDLFITTDTGLAHLAGAAGVRTWLLLGAVADWRWGIDQRHSLWYPTMRLFRQSPTGDWSGVIEQVMITLDSQAQRA